MKKHQEPQAHDQLKCLNVNSKERINAENIHVWPVRIVLSSIAVYHYVIGVAHFSYLLILIDRNKRYQP